MQLVSPRAPNRIMYRVPLEELPFGLERAWVHAPEGKTNAVIIRAHLVDEVESDWRRDDGLRVGCELGGIRRAGRGESAVGREPPCPQLQMLLPLACIQLGV